VLFRSDLSRDLKAGGADSLVIAGLQTDRCVAANALAAFDLGFHVAVVKDACAARSCERHVGALRLLAKSCAFVATTRELCEALS
jgi:isochorismate hydrolase